jgi:hypothetical protein
MAAVAFAVLAFAVFATATVFVVQWFNYLRTERAVERRREITARSESIAIHTHLV